MNDLSAHPVRQQRPNVSGPPIILNTLGDLTNRENRYASPRFCNDFDAERNPGRLRRPTVSPTTRRTESYIGRRRPRLLPDLVSGRLSPTFLIPTSQLINDTYGGRDSPARSLQARRRAYLMAFPYIFPGHVLESRPELGRPNGLGWIHSLDPDHVGQRRSRAQLLMNHAPLDLGDSHIATPSDISEPGFQTWWGFPTWRETASRFWNDPYGVAGHPTGRGFSGTAGQPLAPPIQSPGSTNQPILADLRGRRCSTNQSSPMTAAAPVQPRASQLVQRRLRHRARSRQYASVGLSRSSGKTT